MITVVGGTYRERCIRPHWDALFGSAGRAATALSHRNQTKLVTCAADASRRSLDALASYNGFEADVLEVAQTVSFDYLHPLSVPVISPERPNAPLHTLRVVGDAVLRFGMIEATAAVDGDRVVYDPQSALAPEPFRSNGSCAKSLAIVANAHEVRLMTGIADPEQGGNNLLQIESASVVVVKRGSRGALILTSAGDRFEVPAFRTQSVFSIGSGDIFAAAFAHFWAVELAEPRRAAELASKASARYCETQLAELPSAAELDALPYEPAVPTVGKVYLAGPFFTLAERWLVEEARACLQGMHLDVFSPVHEVGPGPAEVVGPADLAGLEECDRVLALVDGADPGTLFEVGYARKCGKPVIALAETLSEENKKMLVGSGCVCTDDFTSAIYLTAWAK